MKPRLAILLLFLAAGAAHAAGGDKVFNASCVECHGPGMSGAPKLGDKAAWAPRIKQSMSALYRHALKGSGWMPPKGGFDYLSDADVKAAVDYMVGRAR